MSWLSGAWRGRLDQPKGWRWILSIFLIGLGARFWQIAHFGTPLPFWDQWDNARVAFLPYFEGKLSLATLFRPHNEHRIVFTRLYDLGLLLLNGQWDNLPQMALNAIMYSAVIAGFGWLVIRFIGRQFWPLVALLLTAVLVLPFAWENTLAGFQSQVYFVVFFGLLTIWLMGFHRAGSLAWVIGASAAFCGFFSMGAGLFAPAAVCALAVMRILVRPSSWKQHWPTLAVGVAVAGLALVLRVHVPAHEALQAHSVKAFLVSLGKYLAWPWVVAPPFALFNLFPLCLLGWVWFRHSQARGPAEELALALGLWAVFQALASAYFRGGENFPQWRYMDFLSFLMIASVLSLVLLGARHRDRLPLRRYFRGAATLWTLAAASGVVLLSGRAWTVDIPLRQMQHHMQLLTTRAYLATGDRKYVEVQRQEYIARFIYAPTPRERARELVEMLQHDCIRSRLPACARDPLPVTPVASSGFTTNDAAFARPDIPGEVAWSSLGEPGAAAAASFESAPLRSKSPYLDFSVAGDLPAPGLSLRLVELGSGKATDISPCRPSGDQWQTCRVRAPAGEFKIVARDDSATAGFAFKPPRELTWLSFWANRSLGAGKWLLALGLLLFLYNLAGFWANRAGNGKLPSPATSAAEDAGRQRDAQGVSMKP